MAGILVSAALLLAAGLITGFGIFFVLVYVIVGIFAASKLWIWSIGRGLRLSRKLPRRAFLGEKIPVTISLQNRSFLPIPWLNVRETLPHELATYEVMRRVIAIKPRSSMDIDYELSGNRRGYHPVGPLEARYGDVFGFAQRQVGLNRPVNVIVYPEIVPLDKLGLPSTTPFGTIKTPKILYEDPSRVIGCREYKPSDSPRMINWKVSARTGIIHVRQLEPAVSHEVTIFVDLNPSGYSREWVSFSSELSIVVAASLASALISDRQSVGVIVNGLDRVMVGGRAIPAERARRIRGSRRPRVPVGKGRKHLMEILALLARVGLLEGEAIGDELRAGSLRLSWGSTLIVVTGKGNAELIRSLLDRKKAGHNVTAVFTDALGASKSKALAAAAGIEAHAVAGREGLNVWRDGRAAI
ncbi:MAG: DUF58 domain-containing protein [Chloroflexi bacterium]|nr:DUF58 domain-containing protein [Chloroflexota bacterium]